MTTPPERFPGFDDGHSAPTYVPSAFFTALLPLVDDLAELHLLLFCLYALNQREGAVRWLEPADFAASPALRAALERAHPTVPFDDALALALARALARGALLAATLPEATGGDGRTLYFMNTPRGRDAITSIAQGRFRVPPGGPADILPPRPNVFGLYEANIGALTPLIADHLKDALATYPAGWVEDAIGEAAKTGARGWRYIHAVLQRWEKEGRHALPRHHHPGDDYDPEAQRRRLTGDFDDFFEH